MRIYIVSTVGIHKQKHNIQPESRTCVAYKMKKLWNVKWESVMNNNVRKYPPKSNTDLSGTIIIANSVNLFTELYFNTVKIYVKSDACMRCLFKKEHLWEMKEKLYLTTKEICVYWAVTAFIACVHKIQIH
jgi:hypothetical protein